MNITASIVLYENNPQEVQDAIDSCLSSPLINTLYLVDNSPTKALMPTEQTARLQYIYTGKNRGFGAAHNLVIKKYGKQSAYHVIINPDISFQPEAIDLLKQFMDLHPDVGLVMPKIHYKNGQLQRLCKLLPSPLNLFGRRFASTSAWATRLNEAYELSAFQYDKTVDIPNLSGCFLFVRSAVLQQVEGFDERYFLYLEDVDLVRRIGSIARTVFYPAATVAHGYQKESYNSTKLMRIHVASAIKYFNKWGWFYDEERKRRNQDVLSKLRIKR